MIREGHLINYHFIVKSDRDFERVPITTRSVDITSVSIIFSPKITTGGYWIITFFSSGKLTLKIPWKNLYTEAVVASIDGLYALAVPNVGKRSNWVVNDALWDQLPQHRCILKYCRYDIKCQSINQSINSWLHH